MLVLVQKCGCLKKIGFNCEGYNTISSWLFVHRGQEYKMKSLLYIPLFIFQVASSSVQRQLIQLIWICKLKVTILMCLFALLLSGVLHCLSFSSVTVQLVLCCTASRRRALCSEKTVWNNNLHISAEQGLHVKLSVCWQLQINCSKAQLVKVAWVYLKTNPSVALLF